MGSKGLEGDPERLLPPMSIFRHCLYHVLQDLHVFPAARQWQVDCTQRKQEGRFNRMDATYIFLCGVMWHRFGQPEAGEELLTAADSTDSELRALALDVLLNGEAKSMLPLKNDLKE